MGILQQREQIETHADGRPRLLTRLEHDGIHGESHVAYRHTVQVSEVGDGEPVLLLGPCALAKKAVLLFTAAAEGVNSQSPPFFPFGIAGSLTTRLRKPLSYRVPGILAARDTHGITDAREHGQALRRFGLARLLLRESLPRSFLGEDQCPVIHTPLQCLSQRYDCHRLPATTAAFCTRRIKSRSKVSRPMQTVSCCPATTYERVLDSRRHLRLRCPALPVR